MKTLAEIAIEAGLVTRDGAVKAGRIAAIKQLPLIHVLIRELGVDEVALLGALRKQTRVPLIDPADVQADPDALRLVARDACVRLRVLPLLVVSDGPPKVLRVAMADPTDTSAILELEELAHCEVEVTALPLSAIEELVAHGYQQFSTAVVNRNRPLAGAAPRAKKITTIDPPVDGEASVTAQIPLAPTVGALADLELRLMAVCKVLMGKGLLSEAELVEAVRELTGAPTDANE